MRAALLTAPGEVSVRDLPEPSSGDVALIEPECMSICGTDVSILAGKIPVRPPRVLGHEVVGRVVRPGPSGAFTRGDRVVVNPALACGACTVCQRGREHLCTRAGLMGRDVDGVFAELVQAPERQLVAVPEGVSTAAAASVQVLATCVHAQRAMSVFPDDTAVVVGLGVAGMLMVQLLRARGVTVVGVTRAEWKQELGRHFGADVVVTPDDAARTVADVTGGRGADVVVEAVGSTGTLAHAVRLAGPGASVVVFGTIADAHAEDFPFYDLYYKELTLHNPRAARREDYVSAVTLAAGPALDLEPLRTHEFRLDQIADAFAALHGPRALKVTLSIP